MLGAVNLSIQTKEDIKANGETVLLQLAPVDPRSLMQGDYMALRFAITQGLNVESGYQDKRLPLKLDEHRVGQLATSDSVANIQPSATACETGRSGSAQTPTSSRKALRVATRSRATASSR